MSRQPYGRAPVMFVEHLRIWKVFCTSKVGATKHHKMLYNNTDLRIPVKVGDFGSSWTVQFFCRPWE